MENTILDLLEKIHYYYPIGLPQLYSVYPGIKKIEEKVEKKISEIDQDEVTNWTKLRNSIEKQFGKDNLRDESFYQFPNYSLTIDLARSNEDGSPTTRAVILNISLLADYYTIFFRDYYKFASYNYDENSPYFLPEIEIVYCQSCREKRYLDFIESLKLIVKQYFDKHLFVEHSTLFNTKIDGGVVYGKSEEYSYQTRHSIYEYLFFSYFDTKSISILE